MSRSAKVRAHEEPLVITSHDVAGAEPPIPWTDHLEELRYRLWWCVVAVIVGTCVAFAWAKPLVAWLARPMGTLVFTQLPEALLVHVKVALAVGLLAAVPVIVYHAWRFVSAGLSKTERRLALRLIPWSTLLFIGGAAFGFLLVLPQLIRVCLSFSSPALQPMITVNAYCSLVIWVTLAFGAAFELPLAMWGLTRLGVVQPATWRRARLWAILAIFLAAAVLTPGPDVIAQCLLAIPMVLLYEMSAWISGWGMSR